MISTHDSIALNAISAGLGRLTGVMRSRTNRRASSSASTHSSPHELDLNPALAVPDRCIALDASVCSDPRVGRASRA